MRVIGLNSGTSFDAIDAAVADIELDRETIVLKPIGGLGAPYPKDLQDAIAQALPPNPTTLEAVCRLDTLIGQAFANTARDAIARFGPADLIASHGQTLFHWVEDDTVRGTLQLGQPAWIAERTNVPVVADVRARDVAAGGQGAPLVSLLDVLLLQDRPGTPAALNLGGIANLTIATDPPLAFDTGPANALLDAAARHFYATPHDTDGQHAAAGTPIQPLLDRLLDDPYYARPAPKTTGKEHFHLAYLQERLEPGDAPDDILATLTQLTAQTVAGAARRHGVTELIASGGGTRNPALMAALASHLPTTTSDALELPTQHKEAYAFALLGFLTAHGRAGTLPSCTGARHPTVLGAVTPAAPTSPAPRKLRLA
ncbi:MAG TPA: anhydro-N-acetylmuramic acid kinase [Solirubrobacter sp.]|nr:anhydro-N-acetylmuramic acid kinase [Solirubrobacter sp.]